LRELGESRETEGLRKTDTLKNNERPETLSSPGRPGSPPPELLTDKNKVAPAFLPMALPCYRRFWNAPFYPAEKQGLRWIGHKARQFRV